MFGEVEVERDRTRAVAASQREGRPAAGCDDPLELLLAREVEEDVREGRIVLDDQDGAIAGLHVGAVVVDLDGRVGRGEEPRAVRVHGVGRVGGLRRPRGANRGGDPLLVDERNVEGEPAPAPGSAVEADLPAEEARDLAADRETEAGSAVIAARRAVRLLEGLEDDLVLLGRDPYARVRHRERNDGGGRRESSSFAVSRTRPPRCAARRARAR